MAGGQEDGADERGTVGGELGMGGGAATCLRSVSVSVPDLDMTSWSTRLRDEAEGEVEREAGTVAWRVHTSVSDIHFCFFSHH
jgi:hypothetical protein